MKKVINGCIAIFLFSNLCSASNILVTSNYIDVAENGQGCSIEATSAVFLENEHYGPVSIAEAREAWYWYYNACMEVGHNNFEEPVFL